MRVLDYINRANFAEVQTVYAESYGLSLDAQTWDRFWALLNAAITVQTDMQVIVGNLAAEDFDPAAPRRARVGGRDNQGSWSLVFKEWSDWKVMPVVDETGLGLSISEIASHLFYEMTWHGFPEDMIAVRDHIVDMVEAVNREHFGSNDDD